MAETERENVRFEEGDQVSNVAAIGVRVRNHFKKNGRRRSRIKKCANERQTVYEIGYSKHDSNAREGSACLRGAVGSNFKPSAFPRPSRRFSSTHCGRSSRSCLPVMHCIITILSERQRAETREWSDKTTRDSAKLRGDNHISSDDASAN